MPRWLRAIGNFVRRQKLLTLLLVLLAGLSLTPIIVLTRTYGIMHPDVRPADRPVAMTLEEQTETFTCGYHALSTVYRAYGLDPEAERIRWRLGVDTKAVFWLADSTGTFHPDLYMVLSQDHFHVSELDLNAPEAWRKLLGHLETGHPAILLIRRPETGGMHWIVATGGPGKDAQIYDSLKPEPYLADKKMLDESLLSALLVRPLMTDESGISSTYAHKLGSAELVRTTTRLKTVEQRAGVADQ